MNSISEPQKELEELRREERVQKLEWEHIKKLTKKEKNKFVIFVSIRLLRAPQHGSCV